MERITALNIPQTWMMLTQTVGGMRAMIYDVIVTNPMWASIYPLMVLILIIINNSIRRGHTRVIQTFVYEVDRIRYLMALALDHAKPTLIRRQEQLDVIYDNKRKLFSYDPKRMGRSYLVSYDDLKKDIQYLEQLTQISIIQPTQQETLSVIQSYLQRSAMIYRWIGWVISVMTLGVYSLVQPTL